jgi:uncharacterized phage-associated protein
MANVHDVAKYIVEQLGSTTHMTLQKLVYYSQAWSLVWDDRPLFQARIEAWANGPVVPRLYATLRGAFKVVPDSLRNANSGNLDGSERETIDVVLQHYGDKPSQWLSDLTHMESPWRDAREGLGAGERSSREITHAAMAEYYGSL